MTEEQRKLRIVGDHDTVFEVWLRAWEFEPGEDGGGVLRVTYNADDDSVMDFWDGDFEVQVLRRFDGCYGCGKVFAVDSRVIDGHVIESSAWIIAGWEENFPPGWSGSGGSAIADAVREEIDQEILNDLWGLQRRHPVRSITEVFMLPGAEDLGVGAPYTDCQSKKPWLYEGF